MMMMVELLGFVASWMDVDTVSTMEGTRITGIFGHIAREESNIKKCRDTQIWRGTVAVFVWGNTDSEAQSMVNESVILVYIDLALTVCKPCTKIFIFKPCNNSVKYVHIASPFAYEQTEA